MTEEELKSLDKEVKKLKRLASEWASQLHDLVEDKLPAGYQEIPGIAQSTYDACEAWAAANAAYAKHGMEMPHYMGHQVGIVVNELPRVVPYDHTPIQAGMVFSLEPGAYEGPGGTFGARSEKTVLVTESGPEVLSQFKWGI